MSNSAMDFARKYFPRLAWKPVSPLSVYIDSEASVSMALRNNYPSVWIKLD
jgi:hypothetical protein